MRGLKCTLLLFCCLLITNLSRGQVIPCPPNVDFEHGNLGYWIFYTGACCPLVANTQTAPVANRHVLTSGTATDQYGGFPIVAPNGQYSLKLGNNSVNSQAERARYYAHIPAGLNNYSIIFRYAVVFEDPSHAIAEQPRFEVKAYDSATNAIIPCSQFTFVASSNLPGFQKYGTTNIWYKSWTTASINLSNYGGKTVALDFAAGDCGLGAHFGYGYVDLECGLFKINSVACSSSPTTSLSAPPGFATYQWYDSTLTTSIGTGQSITIATPPTTKKYGVILTPYMGFGCPDTLFTTVTVSNVAVNATRDTTICKGVSLPLAANATSDTLPLTYSWTPATGLSCTNCANPIATPTTNTTYHVLVTNPRGCFRRDTVNVYVTEPVVSVSKQDAACFGTSTGSMTASVTGGVPPYTYNWNSSPTQTTATAINLPAGIFTVTVTDSIGCARTKTDTVKQPTILNATAAKTNASCYNGTNGTANASATGGTAPYTYSWNTSPVKTTAAVTGLSAGTYMVTVTDARNCVDTAVVVVTQPPQLTVSADRTNVICFNGNNGTATATPGGGVPPYNYSWNTTPAKTTAAATGLTAGIYIITLTDSNGCTAKDTAIVTQPNQLAVTTIKSNVSCYNGNNGTATAVPAGGTMPYTYSWNSSPVQTTITAGSLSAGTYAVIVTDSNNCTASANAVIAQPTQLTAIATKTDASCNNGNNGTATAVPVGGTSPYTYSWNTSPVQTGITATGLSSGSYTVTITDGNGCATTATAVIGQPGQLSATGSKTDVSCFNGTNGTASVLSTGGVSPHSYSWNSTPVQTTAIATGLPAGTYTVTVTDAQNCITSATVVIAQPPLLATTTSKTDASCNGVTNGTATASPIGGTAPYTYVWTTLPVQTTATATGLAAGTYLVTVTDAKGCISTNSAIVAQPAVLAASASKSDVHCFGGNNGTATAIPAGGTAPYSYSWNTNPVQTGVTATSLTAGTYSVSITDSKGCSTSANATIVHPTQLMASATKNDASCFGGNSGSTSVIASGGSAPYTYSWNTNPVQTTTTANGLPAGTYTATVTDDKGCTITASATVGQPTNLVPVNSKTNVSCYAGNDGAATVTATGGTPPYTYNWNTIPVQTTNTATGLAAGTYIATITDNRGCVKNDTLVVTQPPILSHSIIKNDVSCFGDSNGTATISVTGGTPGYSYTWQTIPLANTQSLVGLKAGIYKVFVKDAKNCPDSALVTISEPALLASNVGHTNVLCHGEHTGSATASASGGTPPYSYAWNSTPAQTGAYASGLPIGKYTATITDAKGCKTNATTDSIKQPGPLLLTATPGNKTCLNAATGTASSIASGGMGPYSYSWNTTPIQNTPNAANLAAGQYIVTVKDANECDQLANVVIEALPSPEIDLTANQTICLGAKATLTAAGAKWFTWTPSTSLTCSNCSLTVASPKVTTVYTVVGIDSNNCADTEQVEVVVVPRVPVAVGPDIDICIGDPANLSANGGQKYLWSPPVDLDDPLSSSPISTTDTAITYSVIITENECFKDTLNQTVRVHPRPTVELGPDKRGIPGAVIQLNAETTNSKWIAWWPETGLSCYDCYDPRATLNKTITYTATVSSGLCEAKDDITIIVGCEKELFFIPNTFTPNGDGANDRFWPIAEGVDVIDRFVIYDRWGEMIFSASKFPPNTPQYGWDGTFKNTQLSPDVYVYYLEAKCGNGEKIFIKGDISLVR